MTHPKTREELPTATPGLCIRQRSPGSDAWEVVHAGSGMAAVPGYYGEGGAQRLAATLTGPGVDWTRDAATLTRCQNTAAVVRQVGAAAVDAGLAGELRIIAARLLSAADRIDQHVASGDRSMTAQRETYLAVYRGLRGVSVHRFGRLLRSLREKRLEPRAAVEAGKQLGVRL